MSERALYNFSFEAAGAEAADRSVGKIAARVSRHNRRLTSKLQQSSKAAGLQHPIMSARGRLGSLTLNTDCEDT